MEYLDLHTKLNQNYNKTSVTLVDNEIILIRENNPRDSQNDRFIYSILLVFRKDDFVVLWTVKYGTPCIRELGFHSSMAVVMAWWVY